MNETEIYRDIALRTDGAFMLGVVGPVRTGKSTFIKRFMETLVIPQIDNTFMRERARDELPQSGSGKTIMTAEPKFIPEEAVSISFGEGAGMSVRLVDCVGYMVEGAAGQFEDGEERLVSTPWFDHEISMTEAAEKGTRKVIEEHSTIGIVVTTDGTICDIPREKYIEPEQRVIRELQAIGKPFVVLVNSASPESAKAKEIAREISDKHGIKALPVNCQTLDEQDFGEIMQSVLEEFPLKAIGIFLPEWVDALADSYPLKAELFALLSEKYSKAEKMKDCYASASALSECEAVSKVYTVESDLGEGVLSLSVQVPRALYYETVSEQSGLHIKNDADLISILTELSAIKKDYDRIRDALESVRTTGYGVVLPSSEETELQEPQIVRQGGKYSIKLKAGAPAIHMIKTDVITEVTPAIGGQSASEDILNFLLQGFDGDVNKIWQSNIFGKSLNAIAEEGLAAKICSLPQTTKNKLQATLERIINEGSTTLICILL